MTDKEVAKNVINSLPKQSTLDDIMHALYVQARFHRGEQEIKQKKGISHDEAKRRLQKWVK